MAALIAAKPRGCSARMVVPTKTSNAESTSPIRTKKESNAWKSRHEAAVVRHDERQQHDLRGRHVRLQLGRPFTEDQRLPHGLEDVVRHEDEKDVQHEEQRRNAFPRAHLREHAEEPFEGRTF
jgi:hypothetical protein